MQNTNKSKDINKQFASEAISKKVSDSKDVDK